MSGESSKSKMFEFLEKMDSVITDNVSLADEIANVEYNLCGNYPYQPMQQYCDICCLSIAREVGLMLISMLNANLYR